MPSPGTLKPLPTGNDLSIENLRGLAIVLMVAVHVIGNRATNGIRVADDSWYRYFDYSLMYLRMPLFTVISGYLYSLRPAYGGSLSFLTGKARRILLPLVTVGSLQFLIKTVVPGVNSPTRIQDFWQIYFFRFEQFWFLHAIFLCFLAVVLLERLRVLDSIVGWLGCIVMAVAAQQASPPIRLFCFSTGFLYLLPHFLLGCGLARHRARIFQPAVLLPVVACLALGVGLQQAAWYGVVEVATDRYSLLATMVGTAGSVVLFYFALSRRPQFQSLAWLGSFSYSIFLFHIFGAAGIRIVLTRLGFEDKQLLFTLSLSGGLLLPILTDCLLQKNRWLATCMLGRKLAPPRQGGKGLSFAWLRWWQPPSQTQGNLSETSRRKWQHDF